MINENINSKIGMRLKECRDAKKITQKSLSEQCYCTPQTISYIETGKRGMSRDLAHRLSKILLVNEEYLLGESDFKTSSEKYLHDEELMNLTDTLAFQYLHSIGHELSFEFKSDKVNDLIDYYLKNNINVKEKTFTCPTYSNDMKINIDGQTVIAHDVKVIIDGTTSIDLVDYLDIIEDLNIYADFLISQAKRRKERRKEHLAIECAERNKREELSGEKLKSYIESLGGFTITPSKFRSENNNQKQDFM